MTGLEVVLAEDFEGVVLGAPIVVDLEDEVFVLEDIDSCIEFVALSGIFRFIG